MYLLDDCNKTMISDYKMLITGLWPRDSRSMCWLRYMDWVWIVDWTALWAHFAVSNCEMISRLGIDVVVSAIKFCDSSGKAFNACRLHLGKPLQDLQKAVSLR